MEDIIKLISQVGVPTAIAVFLLVYQNRAIADNTQALNEMANKMTEALNGVKTVLTVVLDKCNFDQEARELMKTEVKTKS